MSSKLDVAMATHVMKFPKEWVSTIRSHSCYFPEKGKPGAWWKPTEDWAQALLVLGKCLSRNGVVDICISEETEGFWLTATPGPGFGFVSAEGKTLPLAICRFAAKLSKVKA